VTHYSDIRTRVFTGFYCPGGPDGDYLVCKRGFYCPTPAEQYPCPAGTYCPSGTLQPYGKSRRLQNSWGYALDILIIVWLRLPRLTTSDCMPLSTCPEKAWQQRWFLLLLLLAGASVCAYIAYRRYAEQRASSSLKASTQLPAVEQHTADAHNSDETEKSRLKSNACACST